MINKLEDKWIFRKRIAENSNSIDALKVLALDEDWRVRRAVAGNPFCSIEILDYLSNDILEIKETIIKNKNIQSFIISKISNEETYRAIQLKIDIALNKNTEIHLLKELSESKEERIRAAVASNENTPIYILEKLSKDDNVDVRGATVRNKKTEADILIKMIKDIEVWIRKAIIKNPNVTEKILEEMIYDKNISVIYTILELDNLSINILNNLKKTIYYENKEIKKIIENKVSKINNDV